ncbi:hypothetical protein N1F89_08825 [Aquibium sp. A9E412]|uniref:hypothetical protein n=1 Tax=Aquibium sp. A9E412 TaxID=2976767 RepID=UPI0025AEF6C6|nr:hypothetical protein [Aquibium sp. A9E412]MDN2566323.1 hypothetical protein [Aquibium sp. A9E412]
MNTRLTAAAGFALFAATAIGVGGLAAGGWHGAAGLSPPTLGLFGGCGAAVAFLSWWLVDGARSWRSAALAGLLTAFAATSAVAMVLGGGAPFLVPLGLATTAPAFAIPAVVGALVYRMLWRATARRRAGTGG